MIERTENIFKVDTSERPIGTDRQRTIQNPLFNYQINDQNSQPENDNISFISCKRFWWSRIGTGSDTVASMNGVREPATYRYTHSGLIWTEYKLYAYTLAMFSFYWFLLESLLKLFVASNRFILSAFVCKLKCSLNKVGTWGDGCIHTNGIVERGTWWKCFVVLFRQAISPQLR